MQRELVQHAHRFIRVDGLSLDRKRREQGFGVALELAEAIEVARAWEQEALFWFDGHAFWLVPVLSDGRAVRLPAGGRALKAASQPRHAKGAVFDLDAGPRARPQSTRLVGMVSWSWGPAHNRVSVYRLSRDRKRSRWILWDSPQFEELQDEESEGDYPRAHCPAGNGSAREAALMLLGFTWQRERELCGVPDGPPNEVQGGTLISAVEIVALAQQVLGERTSPRPAVGRLKKCW